MGGGGEWMIGLLREGVNNWVSERIFERRNEWTSKSVGEWWNAWTIKWASGCVKLESGWENEEVRINEWRPNSIREWLGYYVKVWIIEGASEFWGEGMSGRVSQWVSDENAWTFKWASGCVKLESEWENEEVWINEWRPNSIREWICE